MVGGKNIKKDHHHEKGIKDSFHAITLKLYPPFSISLRKKKHFAFRTVTVERIKRAWHEAPITVKPWSNMPYCVSCSSAMRGEVCKREENAGNGLWELSHNHLEVRKN
ncbi:hypothetical protein TNCT_738211 [Trichonephila clavata]|uniref:Uncharacterized protein n=1 Tax=Trichonephila clavata TaxID=2740835 RepID=A0A8X6KHG2_TRICU|nr:hypothetical protein TNCT_738211 [Trichonephila clavata]